MKKPKTSVLKINKPCSESWESMQKNNDGRFCKQCIRTVIDLSAATDEEILNIIKTNGRICGRLNPYQLNRRLIKPAESSTFRFSYFLAGLILLASPEIAASQTVPKKLSESSEQILVQQQKKADKKKIPTSTADTIFITGKITDSNNGVGLPGCSILVKGTKITGFTNANGGFKFAIPTRYIKSNVILQITYLGYETKTLSIKREALTKFRRIDLKLQPMLLGEVVVVEEN